jgi:hypothetical protein
MAGDDVGTLNIYYTGGDNSFTNPFFTLSGTKGDAWFNQKFDFVFQGVIKIDVSKKIFFKRNQKFSKKDFDFFLNQRLSLKLLLEMVREVNEFF